MSLKTDVLIIGSGIGGCITALRAADYGAKVILITKSTDLSDTNTSKAQGGIIYKGVSDSPELLMKDIAVAGAGKTYPKAVQFLANHGAKLVKEILIDKLKVPFEKSNRGILDLTEEGAHSIPRIIHSKDMTGWAIQEKLIAAISAHPNIKIFTSATAVDLLTLSHHSKIPTDIYEPLTCIGAYILFQEEGKVKPVFAKETVLATGGLGQLYLHTTNPKGARGDGIALAYRAGARIINLEYIQFHPTALYHTEPDKFLISESVRGEGGILIRKNGEQFMKKYHPQESLAPRDVVARAIHQVMLEYDEPCVYIDITHKPAGFLKRRFPLIYQKCLSYGIDITKQPIPVVPAAHYSCGGVAVDNEGRTTIKRLRAVGEVSCTGAHGANRLASTSLLEAVVWGHSTGISVAKEIKENKYSFPPIPEWKHEKSEVDPALILQDWLTIKYTLWNYVGLVRTTKRMNRAKQILRELQFEIEFFYRKVKLNDEVVGLRNGVQTALAILFACQENHESRGCHYRID